MDGYLPAWLITIISLAGSTVITTIVGLVIKHSFTKWMNKKEVIQLKRDAEHEELEELREQKRLEEEGRHREERKTDVLESVGNLLKPLGQKIDSIEGILTQDKESTIVNIRITMKKLRDDYIQQGFATSADKATWNELYTCYKRMGGNHFKEFVDQWKIDVDNLPNK